MNNHLYYGEIVAKLSAHLYVDYDDAVCIHQILVDLDDECEDISILCADAATVFDQVQGLFNEQFIDWHSVLDLFSDLFKDFLLGGQIPRTSDLIMMAAQSISGQERASVCHL